MGWKKLTKSNKNLTQEDNVEGFKNSASLQLALEEEGYEIVYVDEFSLASRKTEFYGWSF